MNWTLIARKNGSSSTRRQRRFPNAARLVAAVQRWELEGFNTWWIFADGVPVYQWVDDREEAR